MCPNSSAAEMLASAAFSPAPGSARPASAPSSTYSSPATIPTFRGREACMNASELGAIRSINACRTARAAVDAVHLTPARRPAIGLVCCTVSPPRSPSRRPRGWGFGVCVISSRTNRAGQPNTPSAAIVRDEARKAGVRPGSFVDAFANFPPFRRFAFAPPLTRRWNGLIPDSTGREPAGNPARRERDRSRGPRPLPRPAWRGGEGAGLLSGVGKPPTSICRPNCQRSTARTLCRTVIVTPRGQLF